MMSSSSKNQILLTLVIDKNKQKVLHAKAGKYFVDVLLSFLTFPLATVSTLVSEDSTVQRCRFNCITSSRQSLEKLDPKHFSAKGDKEMLLNLRSPMDHYYKNNGYHHYDNTPLSKGFKGYVREAICYIISDDLRVMFSDMNTTLWMLQSFGIECVKETLRLTLNITQKEVWALLKFSLWSKKLLTDLFLRKKLYIDHYSETHQVPSKVKINEVEGKVGIRMRLRVMVSKSERKLLFPEAEEGFIDHLLIFLTIPLATVERLEKGNSDLGCIDNLYESSADWNETTVFDSSVRDLKNNLLNPQIESTKVKNQLLPVYNLGSSSGNNIGGVYKKSGTKFMVTDGLCIEPFSSPSALSLMVESKVAERDLEQMDLSIGVNEVFGILKAAMLSTSALTIGLRSLLTRVKEEK